MEVLSHTVYALPKNLKCNLNSYPKATMTPLKLCPTRVRSKRYFRPRKEKTILIYCRTYNPAEIRILKIVLILFLKHHFLSNPRLEDRGSEFIRRNRYLREQQKISSPEIVERDYLKM